MVLYAATTNAGKLRDFAWAADGYLPGGERAAIEALPGLKEIAAPQEDGATFETNARLKARYYSARAAGMWVVADDSGLEVDALGGRPGVRSARFAEDVERAGTEGLRTLDERNNAALLRMMNGVPGAKRTARYKCVLALARDGDVKMTVEGMLEGEILFAARGEGGFGYDPLFWLPEAGMTMAEVGPEVRMRLSHRGRALRGLLEQVRGRVE